MLDFEKLKRLNESGMIVNVNAPSAGWEQLMKESHDPYVRQYIRELATISKQVHAFRSKYPQIYQ